MALLAEVVVEEWLNRQGYFTVRGIKLGVDEIDLLAIRLGANSIECRHLEVQASMRPISYISKVPRAAQRAGRAANSAKRSPEELVVGVHEWVANKFNKPKKQQLMLKLAPGPWSRELVIHRVKSKEEVVMIREAGVQILHLGAITRQLRSPSDMISSAGGADFLDLLHMSDHSPPSIQIRICLLRRYTHHSAVSNDRCCRQRQDGTLCNCGALRAPPFTANLF